MKRRRRGSGTIETFRDKESQLRYRARVPREDGTREPLGVYPTREAAELAIDAARNRSAELVRIGGATVKDYGPGFLDNREHARIRGIRTERNRWAVLVDGAPLGALPIRAVQRADAKAWVRWLLTRRIKYSQKHPKNGKRLGRVTMQNALNLVRKAFEEAQDDLDLPSNPFAGIKIPKGEGRTHEPWTYLTFEEQGRLLDACKTSTAERAMVQFALYTGLRQAEQWSLRWEDVGPLKVTVRYGAAGLPTKSGKVRRVPLLDQAQIALDLIKRRKGCPVVFHNRSGNRRSDGPPPWWPGLLERAGLGDPKERHDGRPVRWHDLRHTCATSLLTGWWGRVWSMREVQAMLGHASITTTERYGHLVDTVLDEAARETRKPAVSPRHSSNQDSTLPERST